jgi:CheY-like chemotaxis protein
LEGVVESTPEDAIRRAAALHPDLAFVARLMPGCGGALLAAELQKASQKTTPMMEVTLHPSAET